MANGSQWNFTLDDASPMFVYTPYADGANISSSWQTWYSASGFASTPGATPQGESYHLTSSPGASVSLQFYGTGISLYGISKGNCPYDVVVDNVTQIRPSPQQNILYSASGLTAEQHVVELIARPNSSQQQLGLDQAVITSWVNSSHPSPSITSYKNDKPGFAYNGSWTTGSLGKSSSSKEPSSFHITEEQYASVSMNFTGRAVSVHGPATAGRDQFQVILDGASTSWNGSSQWLLADDVLFYQDGLDENAQHTLTVVNGGQNSSLAITSVAAYNFDQVSAEVSSASSQAKTGQIVGPVVTILVLLTVLAMLLWSRWRSKRRNEYLAKLSALEYGGDDSWEARKIHNSMDSSVTDVDAKHTKPPRVYVRGSRDHDVSQWVREQQRVSYAWSERSRSRSRSRPRAHSNASYSSYFPRADAQLSVDVRSQPLPSPPISTKIGAAF